MKLRKLFLLLIMVLASASSAFATQMPQQVIDYILKEDSKATIRFDGLITLGDGTIYLPVVPAYLDKVEKLQSTYVYPKNTVFANKPEVIVFNNNFSLLKLIKNQSGILTTSQDPNMPTTVKTGSIPQDLLVPKGLVMPESLKGVLGNVQIPILNSSVVDKKPETTTAKAPLPNKKAEPKMKSNIFPKLNNKIYFVTNFDSQYIKVFSSGLAEPLYSLKLDGVPKDMKPALNGKYLLIINTTQKYVDVVDVRYEFIAKQIELGVYPDEIVVDNINKKAYVSSISDQSIFIIDLNEMKIKEKIQIIGAPQKLTLSQDGTQLGYVDRSTSNVYILRLGEEYENKLIINQSNIAKMILNNNKLYSIDRTKQILTITDYNLDLDLASEPEEEETQISTAELTSSEGKSKKQVVFNNIKSGFKAAGVKKEKLNPGPTFYSTAEKEIPIGIKPNDMLLYNDKLYVLCSENNEVYVLDTAAQSVNTNLKLPVSGFSKRITLVPNTNMAIITNVLTKKYVVMDLDKESTLQTLDINMPVNGIVVVDKL